MHFSSGIRLKTRLVLWYSKRFAKRKVNEGLTTGEYEFSQIFPAKVLKKRHKTPEAFYLANQKGADMIADAMRPNISTQDTLLEFNPGIGLMTQKFVEWKTFKNIVLIERNEGLKENPERICKQNGQKFITKNADLINLWKLVFQDKVDNGSRVETLLEDIPRKAYTDDTNMVVFGAAGSYIFFKHLINSIVFQTSLFSFGRCELFVVMPPPIYVHLTCNNEIGYMVYRSTSMLFQILFEYRFITKVPREYFLPEQTEYKLNKSSKLNRVNSINPDYLYLVKIVPRQNLFDLCAVEDLQALWYFVRQNCISRRNRVIPNLEKLVPGCGPRLIVKSTKSEIPKDMFSNDESEFLPKYSTRCIEMTNKNYFPHINIYTDFGDLSPSQMLTLFCQFRGWPEYKDSSFLASLENSLLKLESSVDGSVDALDVSEEDDVTITQ